MINEKKKDLREKILKGVEKAYSKLLVLKQNEGGEIVVSKDGKVVVINPKQNK